MVTQVFDIEFVDLDFREDNQIQCIFLFVAASIKSFLFSFSLLMQNVTGKNQLLDSGEMSKTQELCQSCIYHQESLEKTLF